ncbi:TetR family transcriptional regulator [Mycolicibacterium bacteremicum]|uniref:TetR family transcriptional regulator n=1 Tax=Mycolicibacterium bacteremicum TaxID=564198 RepID=A0A1W9YQG8_MYCBA|nr:TetR family transcriptional regulator [Mycolicibacterium bacteremicum]MCV7432790.1 TetR family transcriptional regulator [Mycolicibacterium bacteremicum]ORA02293.1 TetR family transcriptional regulator [Mycolicibacterium bacteremicum]
MPRPRVYDLDTVLDTVEALVVAQGPAAVTVRAVAAAAGLSNGALYHNFSSRADLLGRAWLRAGARFLALQRAAAAATTGVDAVVAAAEAPADFAERYPDSARLVLTVRREEVLGPELSDGLDADLRDLDRQLVSVLVALADDVWGRRDAAAVDTITICIVDLPTAILLNRDRLADPTARAHLRAAVRAVLQTGPPPRKERHR